MNEWRCDKCGATYKQKLPAVEVGHWCKKSRNHWRPMKKQE